MEIFHASRDDDRIFLSRDIAGNDYFSLNKGALASRIKVGIE